MSNITLAAIFLLVSHLGLSSSRLRNRLAQRFGEQRFLTVFKLLTLAAFAWLIVAYWAAPTRIIWIAPPAVKLAILPFVLLAFVLVVAGVTTPNPTVIGAAQLFDRPGVVRGILRVTRNSFLWGVGLWSLAHVAATGDVASVLMFGSIGALGLVGALLLDAKKAARHGAQWREFAAATSSVPFLAIVQRRQRLVVAEIGWWRLALAALVFLIALYGHHRAFGVSPLPRI
jgi:uncharacterized membrane protein